MRGVVMEVTAFVRAWRRLSDIVGAKASVIVPVVLADGRFAIDPIFEFVACGFAASTATAFF